MVEVVKVKEEERVKGMVAGMVAAKVMATAVVMGMGLEVAKVMG
jgi:hypothetical protein